MLIKINDKIYSSLSSTEALPIQPTRRVDVSYKLAVFDGAVGPFQGTRCLPRGPAGGGT